MATYPGANLDLTFQALADGTGRSMILSYSVITPPSKIVFSWVIEPPDEHAGIESEVQVAITPDGIGSELVIRHDKFGRKDAVERHAVGWKSAIDQLTALLAQEDEHGR